MSFIVIRSAIVRTALGIAVLGLLVTGTSALADFQAAPEAKDLVKCRRAVLKETGKYIKAVQKNVDKCKKAVIAKGDNGGSLSNCTVVAIKAQADDKIEASADKMKAGVAKKCCGKDKACGVGLDDASGEADLPLDLINWGTTPSSGTCPTFEGSCGAPIADGNDIGTCIECHVDLVVEQALDTILYDLFNPAAFFPANGVDPGKRVNKCQETIAKVGGKFLLTKQKILSKCWDGKLNQQVHASSTPTLQCPDADLSVPNKSVDKINESRQQDGREHLQGLRWWR